MSAPTALESGALVRGIAHKVQPGRPPPPGGFEVERRSSHPVSALSREFDSLCRQACDPLEIAAGLETAGLDDRRARREYQSAGVFEVAEHLWDQVPWRAVRGERRPDRWRLPLWRAQLRGLLYVLPALVAAAAFGHLDGVANQVLLFSTTAVSIATGQALAVLGHLLAGRGQRRAVSALMPAAFVAAVTTIAVVAGVTALLGGPTALSLACGGQLLFVVGATLLMIDGRDRLLLALITPGVVIVCVQLAGVHIDQLLGAPAGTGYLAAGLLTVLMTTAAAWVALHGGSGGESLRRALGPPELAVAGVAGVYGLGLAATVCYAVLAVAVGRVEASAGHIAAATLPMTATFGTAEYLLHRARSRSVTGLGRARTVRGFARTSRGELRSMVGLHAATATMVAAGVVTAAGWGRPALALSGYAVGYAVLGVTLLLTTMLMSLGCTEQAAGLVCVSAAALLLPLAAPQQSPAAVVSAQLAVLLVFLVVSYRMTLVRFTSTSAHR